MGYAIDGKFFHAAKEALRRDNLSDRLVGVYLYDNGQLHVVTSEDDSTPRLVLIEVGDGSFSLDLTLTAEQEGKRKAAREAEARRQAAQAAYRDARTAKVMYDVDEAEVILGSNISIKNFHDPLEVVRYLTGIGVRVEYTDADNGEVTIYEPTLR